MAQGVWLTNSLGGHLTSPKLSKQMREQANPLYLFRQFTVVKDGYGANKGDTVQFVKRLRIDTRGGTLTETNTVPKNTIKFVKESVTVNEYGNGVDYTGKLEDLAEFDVKDQYAAGLVEDQKDTLDRQVHAQFILANLRAVCSLTNSTVFTTNAAQTVTATANPSDANVRDIIDELSRRQTPKYKGGNYYMALLSVNALRGVYDFLQAVAQYADPQFRFTNEVGQYYACRMMQETNVLSNTVGSGSNKGEGIFFGDDAVCEAVALPEELRYEETDLGRSKTLGWYAILGFRKIWDIDTDNLNSQQNGIERIIYMTSA